MIAEPLPAIGDFVTGVAVALIGLGILFPKPVTGLQMTITVALILAARVYFLPALFLLQITRTDFLGGNAAGFDVMLERFETIIFFIGPFPVNTNYVLLVGVVMRVIFEVCTNPARLRGVMSYVMVIGWLVSLAVDVQISLMSRAEGSAAWTIPVRTTLVLVSFWYGSILTRDIHLISSVVNWRLVWIALLWLAWSAWSPLATSSRYFFYALLAAAAVSQALDKQARHRLVGASLFALTGIHAAGIKYGSDVAIATGRLVSAGSTLTVMMSALLGGALALPRCFLSPEHANYRQQNKLKWLATITFVIVVAGLTLPPLYVPEITRDKIAHDSKYGTGHDRTIAERIYYKLLIDRAAVWRGALEDIYSPPYIIKPMPLESRIIYNDGSSYKWIYGSHSLLLELLSKKAWLSGCFSYVFMMLALRSALTYAFAGKHPGVAVLAISSAAVGIASSIGGSAVANAWEGFLFLGFAGMAQAQLVRESPR